MAESKTQRLQKKAYHIRESMFQMLVPTVTHHIGCSLDIVEILTVLYFHVMTVFPKNPESEKRDIFLLSKGHAGLALYATLAERGFFSKKALDSYDKDGGLLPEHASRVVPGIELSTGSLGHALPVGLGFALDFKRLKKKNRVFVVMSDGELDEGSNWEAFLFANQHKLDNVCIIIDYNKFQGFGKTKDVINLDPLPEKFKAFGWDSYEVDGHNMTEMIRIFNKVKDKKNKKPSAIIAHTIKGKGAYFFEGKFESHYHSLSPEQIKELQDEHTKKHL